MRPQTQYAKSGDVHIAYQTFGSGPRNLVFVPGFISQIETYWDEPGFARWLERIGHFTRVAVFDKRGTGLSDRGVATPDMDKRMDDIRAVMDAAGFDTASVMGISEGGSLAAVFAAYHARRCEHLVLYGAFASFTSWFPTQEALQELFDYAESAWGTGTSLPLFCPSTAGDLQVQDWWGKYERTGASPRDVIEIMKVNSQIDITAILPAIKAPALVLHKTEDALIDIEGGRTLAAGIPNARLIELSGTDHFPFIGPEAGQIVAEIEEFVTGSKADPVVDRVLAAIVFTDIAGSTARAEAMGDSAWRSLKDAHDARVRQELQQYDGREIKSLGDGFLATFDGPGRAIQCAGAIRDAISRLGLDIRVAVHTGEVEVTEDDVRGLAVHIASRIADLAQPGDIVVSRTVKDLVAGSGFCFESLGSHELKGLPDRWQVYKTAA
ncbi:adenylate/guanylate cyclase domain-containing protein [Leisingera sp. ANG-S5]|uniref:adenylate/guanylate cyclase domain-containing protein n=1 Tax=Leisingera sp. ANG-S5 TaxID=1577901 RepID=UPI00057D6915|nr:adenylate/guanylate cyclase domain-containing protein [Leisingera sp. ANG-S5]KIC34619.1 hydrolase [Leisingera sp. ANG-S5]